MYGIFMYIWLICLANVGISRTDQKDVSTRIMVPNWEPFSKHIEVGEGWFTYTEWVWAFWFSVKYGDVNLCQSPLKQVV